MNAALGASLLLGGAPRAAACQSVPRTHVLIVTGASGEPRFGTTFHTEATGMRSSAMTTLGIPDSLIIYLSEDRARDPATIAGRSTKEGLTKAFETIASRAKPDDLVFILLIGHGTADKDVSRFNLPGPDMTDAEFAKQLDRFGAQTVAFVNASSASGDFVKRVAGPRRIIITATKSGFEGNETIFASHFVAAYAKDGADQDKDGRISLLEAFGYARREVQRAYEKDNKLLTEHAVLDDDGDGVGHADASDKGPDGLRARSLFLAPAAGISAAVAATPQGVELLATQRRVQAQIDSLRLVKAGMSEEDFQKALEPLMVQLAEATRALRALEVRKP